LMEINPWVSRGPESMWGFIPVEGGLAVVKRLDP
jgi:hypothetical protein